MKLELAQLLEELCSASGEDIEIREYQGRGQRKPSMAITGNFSMASLLALVIENADRFVDEDGDPIFESVGNLSQDSMGLDTIIY